jgi:PAS domain-containing protein
MDFSIFDELLDGVLVIGLDYKIVYANDSAKRLLNVQKGRKKRERVKKRKKKKIKTEI